MANFLRSFLCFISQKCSQICGKIDLWSYISFLLLQVSYFSWIMLLSGKWFFQSAVISKVFNVTQKVNKLWNYRVEKPRGHLRATFEPVPLLLLQQSAIIGSPVIPQARRKRPKSSHALPSPPPLSPVAYGASSLSLYDWLSDVSAALRESPARLFIAVRRGGERGADSNVARASDL